MFYLWRVNKSEDKRVKCHYFRASKLIKILRRQPFLYYFNNLMFRLQRLNGIVFLFIIFLAPCQIRAQLNTGVRTVVIDAGHGGHDPGAIGRQSKEKNINLAIALKLGNLIQRNFKTIRVIYTRDRDQFVELYRRAEIANQNKADLFISIHCNANESRALQGAETYVMGLHKSKANLDIAKLENASILLESNYQSSYDGFDPNSDESYILFSLYQNANLDRSADFAVAVQEQMVERVGLQNRGVRQAGFLVLYKTTMPSVLVETGYISNSKEEKFIVSSQGQDFIASAIFRAFKSFASSGTKIPNNQSSLAQKDSSLNESMETVEVKADSQPHAKPAETIPAKSKIVIPDKKPDRSPAPENSLKFRIQVATSATGLPENSKIFSQFKSVSMYKHGGLFKYTVGNYSDLAKVKGALAAVKEKGYSDAFIVIFRNNERIPQEEADSIFRK